MTKSTFAVLYPVLAPEGPQMANRRPTPKPENLGPPWPPGTSGNPAGYSREGASPGHALFRFSRLCSRSERLVESRHGCHPETPVTEPCPFFMQNEAIYERAVVKRGGADFVSRVPAHPLRRRLRSILPISDLSADDLVVQPATHPLSPRPREIAPPRYRQCTKR